MNITAVKTGKTYKGTANNDIISIPTSAGKNITVKAGRDIVIDAGKGNDTIVVSAGVLKSVNLVSGTNKLTVSGGTVKKIVGGTGNDTIVVSKQKNLNISAGNGVNNITVTGINDSYYVSEVSKGKIVTGSGADTIIIKKGGFYKINTGSGKDTVKIYGGSHIVKTGASNDIITINSNRSNVVDAGSGNDTMTLKGYTSYNKIVGGSGNDTFNINNTGLNLFEGGTGNDTYKVSSLYAETVIDNSSAGKNDKDVVKIKGSIDSVYNLAYDRSRDILMCNEIFIKGFKKLSSVTISDGRSSFTSSPGRVINMAYSFNLGGVNTEINAYNKNLNTIANKGFTTDYLAYCAGYIGVHK